MKKTTTLNLSNLQICPTDSVLNQETEFSIKRTARRYTFLIDTSTTHMNIKLTFNKENSTGKEEKSGLRQRISVMLYDATKYEVISETSFYAYLPKGIEQKIYTKSLDFKYFEINTLNDFIIIVINESENRQIGSYEFCPIDTNDIYSGFSKSITITEARCISNIDYDSSNFISFNPKVNPVCLIGFWGRTKLDATETLLKEFELKIHHPDGRIESYIKAPSFYPDFYEDSPDAPNMVRVREYLYLREEGTYYAELLLMGKPISGFLFRGTEDNDYEGDWKDYNDNLDPISHYSHEIGEKLFFRAIDSVHFYDRISNNEDSQKELDIEWDDEAFDKSLDDFINSAIDETQNKNSQKDEEEESKEENNDEEDDEFEQLCNDFSKSLHDAVNNMSENETDDEDCYYDEELNYDENECDQDSHDGSDCENSWDMLDNLTGLQSVKDKLYTYKRLVNFTKLRNEKNLSTTNISLHSIFLGSPGTGKTTVAKALGKMLFEAGILSKGHVVIKERANLIGKYYGCEEENTLKAIEEAQGGILFIDEAYQLVSEHDPRDPGRFVIETLITKLSDESNRDWMLILAGYPDEMMRLYNINPGLASRIPQSNIFTFDDFTENELMEIAENYLSRNQYVLSDEARETLFNKLKADYSSRDKSFGNARHVMNLIQLEILPRIATRISENPNPSIYDLTTILAVDIPEPIKSTATPHRRIGFC